MGEEIWKDIVGYEGYYQASNSGRIRSIDRVITNNIGVIRPLSGKELRKAINKDYEYVELCRNNIQKMYSVHQLVAMTFLNHTPCGHKLVIDHIDGNPLNNSVNNLDVVTQQENVKRGRVTECLPNALYRVELEPGNILICYPSGKMKLYHIKILPGDYVDVIVDPYGGKATNRIIKRL